MSYARLATRLYNAPLFVWPARADELSEVFQRYVHARDEGRGVLEAPRIDPPPRHEFATPGITKADGGYYRTADGVALIPVVGTLVQRGDSMDAMSGFVSYGKIAGQLQAALDDPRVDAILLEIDSPGGEANGVMDLGAKVAAAAQKKPTWAHANEQAFSSAYWIAAQASRLLVPQTGMVGSVGVYAMHVDQSQRDAKQGLVYTPIHAGARKVDFNSHAPLSDAARAFAQEDINRLYDLFVAAVADGRGIDEQIVRDTEAGLLNPKQAMAIGFVDGIASFDEALAALGVEAQQYRTRGRRVASVTRAALSITDESPEGENAMPPDTKPTATEITEAQARGFKEGETAATAKAAEAAAAAAKALTDAQAKATADAKAAGDAAQARIAGILGHAEAKDRRALAEHLAFKTTSSVDEAVALLTVSAKEAAPANLLAAKMAEIANPSVGAEGGGGDEATTLVQGMLAAHKGNANARLRAVK